MTMKLGVKFSPQVIAELMRIGAKITGNHGFAASLTENGIPADYQMINSGVDRETGEFFLVFSKGGRRSPDPVQWQAPVYERDKEAPNGTST